MARSCFSDSRARWAGRINEAFVGHVPLCLAGNVMRISYALSTLQKEGWEKGNPPSFINAVKGECPEHRQIPACKSHSMSKSRRWCWKYQTQHPLWVKYSPSPHPQAGRFAAPFCCIAVAPFSPALPGPSGIVHSTASFLAPFRRLDLILAELCPP